jgi:hypothetical protein
MRADDTPAQRQRRDNPGRRPVSEELGKFSGPAHTGAPHQSPYPQSRLAPAIELVDLAREISRADRQLAQRAGGQLQLIVEQIKALQAQARRILEDTRRDQDLHRVPCNFQRRPGQTYYLYEAAQGRRYFSLLSPGDWRGRPPHMFIGAYILQNDLSWIPAGAKPVDDDVQTGVRQLLESGLAPRE